MKIRIKGNSLRYRLTRSEVEQLTSAGYIEEKINFGNRSLYYALQRTDQKELSASFADDKITFYLPAAMAENWADNDVTGFENSVQVNELGEKLFLLVEKDFTCLDKVDEDQSDNYPNPLLKNIYE